MDTCYIKKYNNIEINLMQINKLNIKYNFNNFLIQTPIFLNYEILNLNTKKFLELKLDESKISHNKFLTLINCIELKLNNFLRNYNNNNLIKTHINTDIQNKKSLKVKFADDTKLFDKNKNEINNLYTNKICLLLKLEFYNVYYCWTAIQILQIN